MRIENIFYVGEHGFYFNLKTGIDMTGLSNAAVRAVWLKPDGVTLSPAPSIPTGDRIDPETGDVNVNIPQGLLAEEGTYLLQVVAQIAGGVLASRPIEFQVK